MSPQNPGADTGSQPLNESPAQKGGLSFSADLIRSDQRLMKRSRLSTRALATSSALYIHRLANRRRIGGINDRSWHFSEMPTASGNVSFEGEQTRRKRAAMTVEVAPNDERVAKFVIAMLIFPRDRATSAIRSSITGGGHGD